MLFGNNTFVKKMLSAESIFCGRAPRAEARCEEAPQAGATLGKNSRKGAKSAKGDAQWGDPEDLKGFRDFRGFRDTNDK